MRISVIQTSKNYLLSQRTSSFKGLLVPKKASSDSWSYKGEASGSSYDGNYQGSNDTYSYIYYPFKDEPEHKIQEEIRKNNYSTSGDAGGYYYNTSYETTRGKTLPYTEREWKNLPKSIKEKFEAML